MKKTFRSAAFTLLEVVVSTAILGMLMVTLWSWLMATQRQNVALQQKLSDLDAVCSIMRLLQDDLVGASVVAPNRLRPETAHALEIRTLARIPGQANPGFRTVRWSWTPAAGLLRSESDVSRVISTRFEFSVVVDDEHGGRWWCRLVPKEVPKDVPKEFPKEEASNTAFPVSTPVTNSGSSSSPAATLTEWLRQPPPNWVFPLENL